MFVEWWKHPPFSYHMSLSQKSRLQLTGASGPKQRPHYWVLQYYIALVPWEGNTDKVTHSWTSRSPNINLIPEAQPCKRSLQKIEEEPLASKKVAPASPEQHHLEHSMCGHTYANHPPRGENAIRDHLSRQLRSNVIFVCILVQRYGDS